MNIGYGEKYIATALLRRFLSLSSLPPLFPSKISKRLLRDDSFGIHVVSGRRTIAQDDRKLRRGCLSSDWLILTSVRECTISNFYCLTVFMNFLSIKEISSIPKHEGEANFNKINFNKIYIFVLHKIFFDFI